MIVSLIVAMDEDGGIGKHGGIPWRLSADLKRFKQLTMGHCLVMGRKTYETIGRALPGRTNIIVTRQADYVAPGCLVACSMEAALELAKARREEEVFVIGGGEIFAQALPLASRIYLTRVHARLDCDVFFPPLDFRQWTVLERSEHTADQKNQYASTYMLLEKRIRP